MGKSEAHIQMVISLINLMFTKPLNIPLISSTNNYFSLNSIGWFTNQRPKYNMPKY